MAPAVAPIVRPSRRFIVLQRDGFRCRYCGRSPEKDGVTLQVDHVHPRSQGGTNELDNLVTACWECNIGKSARLLRPAPPELARVPQRRPKSPRRHFPAIAPRLSTWQEGSHCSTPLKVAAMAYQYGWKYRTAWMTLNRLSLSSPMFGSLPPLRAVDEGWMQVVVNDPLLVKPLVNALERGRRAA